MASNVLVLLSGGMDSTALVAALAPRGVDTVSINYGQRHRRELQAAEDVAAHFGVRHDVVDLSILRASLAGSSLTSDEVAVPDGHYTFDTMRATVVPNRNLIMLSVAAGIAVSRGIPNVATAVHAGDHFIYPDCRPQFVGAAAAALYLGTDTFGPGGSGIQLLAPFLHMTKAQIVRSGVNDEAPFQLSWSCYKGGAQACGRCGTCVERLEAFAIAGTKDPIEYEDRTYWEEAVEAVR